MKCGATFSRTPTIYKDETSPTMWMPSTASLRPRPPLWPTRLPPRVRVWTMWSSWPASSRRRLVWRARMPGSAPASPTTAWNPATRCGRSISWNPTPAAISCRIARTTISGTPRRLSTSAGRIGAQFPTMCWLCTTPTPSAACQRAPSPARVRHRGRAEPR